MKNSNFKENVNYVVNKEPFIDVRGNLIDFGLGKNLKSATIVCNVLHEINSKTSSEKTVWVEKEEVKRA